MRRLLLWSSVAGFTACLLQPTLATITPDYGYADGCQQVILQGHHLGENATAKLVGPGGSADFLEFRAATREDDMEGVPEHASDVGFKYYGTVPASPDGGSGWYDVVLTVDGEELTIDQGWYYRSCPGAIVVDAYDIPPEAAVGATLTFQGCNLTEGTELQLVDPISLAVVGSAPLQSVCSTAITTADVPSVAAGTYNLQLSNGTDLYPFEVCAGHSASTGYAHSGASACDPITLTVTAR
jgi:hypothetical protein